MGTSLEPQADPAASLNDQAPGEGHTAQKGAPLGGEGAVGLALTRRRFASLPHNKGEFTNELRKCCGNEA